jgi:hypothetical protein
MRFVVLLRKVTDTGELLNTSLAPRQLRNRRQAGGTRPVTQLSALGWGGACNYSSGSGCTRTTVFWGQRMGSSSSLHSPSLRRDSAPSASLSSSLQPWARPARHERMDVAALTPRLKLAQSLRIVPTLLPALIPKRPDLKIEQFYN